MVSTSEIHPEDAKLQVHPLEEILGDTPPPVTDSKIKEFFFAPANFNMIDTGVSM